MQITKNMEKIKLSWYLSVSFSSLFLEKFSDKIFLINPYATPPSKTNCKVKNNVKYAFGFSFFIRFQYCYYVVTKSLPRSLNDIASFVNGLVKLVIFSHQYKHWESGDFHWLGRHEVDDEDVDHGVDDLERHVRHHFGKVVRLHAVPVEFQETIRN